MQYTHDRAVDCSPSHHSDRRSRTHDEGYVTVWPTTQFCYAVQPPHAQTTSVPESPVQIKVENSARVSERRAWGSGFVQEVKLCRLCAFPTRTGIRCEQGHSRSCSCAGCKSKRCCSEKNHSQTLGREEWDIPRRRCLTCIFARGSGKEAFVTLLDELKMCNSTIITASSTRARVHNYIPQRLTHRLPGSVLSLPNQDMASPDPEAG